MELPAALRDGVRDALEHIPTRDLQRAAAALSQRYRTELRDGTLHVGDALSASAYLAVRLPATYAAVRASLAAVTEARPSFLPRTLLDVGAGPGTALWAAHDCWPAIADAVLLEASAAMRAAGERLGHPTPDARITWKSGDALVALAGLAPRDLVILAYVLDELEPALRGRLVDRLWALTADTLVIVEPGTPAGWKRILDARTQLLFAGAHLLAPCPHAEACPLVAPDWCHFSQRLARSPAHRRGKAADMPWEDEKYIYLAACRHPGARAAARVIARPRLAGGQVRLKLCRHDGSAAETLLSRRDGAAYRTARRLDWGTTAPTEIVQKAGPFLV